MPINPSLGKLRQKEYVLKVSPSYTVRIYLKKKKKALRVISMKKFK